MQLVLPRFLDLPSGLRHRIYVEAGLVINNDQDLLLNPKKNRQHGEQPDLLHSLALMLVCRIVHNEASLLFYSTNRFIIRFHRAGDLRALHILQPKLLSAITCLTVQLNVADAIQARHAPKKCPRSDDKLLQAHCSSAQRLLLEWETTVEHLSRHIKAEALDFGLVCDVADVETAQHVVAPLYRLAPLAACHIRLGPKPSHDDRLRQIVREAGLKAEGRKHTSLFHGFSRLPLEIRLRILEYTDLVAPLSKVSWILGVFGDRRFRLSYDIGKQCTGNRPSCEPPYDVCHPNVHQACLRSQCQLGLGNECPHYASGWGWSPEEGYKSRCWTCTHYACQFRWCWRAKKRGSHQVQFCFCQRHHVSYTPSCHCWEPPTPLFLVSNAFRRDALQVFFSKNHFEIDYSWAGYYTGNDPSKASRGPRPTCYPESVFLKNVVSASALQYLRSLEFRFLSHDRLPPGYPSRIGAGFLYGSMDWVPLAGLQSEESAEAELACLQEWQQTVDRITSNNGNAPALSFPRLILHINASWVAGLDTWEDYCSQRAVPLDQTDSAIDTIKTFVAFFWPPLLRSGQSQMLFAFFQTNLMQAGYFIRPIQQKGGRSIHMPPEFAAMWHEADLTVERTVTAELDSGESRWVEGIWATYNCLI
ncbi:hypothetical protein N431DRAFT_486439 [Stipitochalara longipes BDJ]|nr:hypothetical protein N431DRAFT_486439 [Stipitochalara longipes BDJ]